MILFPVVFILLLITEIPLNNGMGYDNLLCNKHEVLKKLVKNTDKY